MIGTYQAGESTWDAARERYAAQTYGRVRYILGYLNCTESCTAVAWGRRESAEAVVEAHPTIGEASWEWPKCRAATQPRLWTAWLMAGGERPRPCKHCGRTGMGAPP